jgi:hypothetical protein
LRNTILNKIGFVVVLAFVFLTFSPGISIGADFSTDKVKVCWHHDDLHVEGKLYFSKDALRPDESAMVTVTLASIRLFTDMLVDFEIKGKDGNKWEYKDKNNLDGIKEFKIDWKKDHAKFKLVSAFNPVYFNGTDSLPDDLEFTITLGDGEDAISIYDLIGVEKNWTKQDDKHWEYKKGREAVEPPSDDGCCEGKVVSLTMQYNGEYDDIITVEQKNGDVVFHGIADESTGLFSFSGTDKNGTLGTEISFYVDGVLNTKIHTSCSKPIGPGLVSDSGDFEVIGGFSRNGGPLCPLPGQPPACEPQISIVFDEAPDPIYIPFGTASFTISTPDSSNCYVNNATLVVELPEFIKMVNSQEIPASVFGKVTDTDGTVDLTKPDIQWANISLPISKSFTGTVDNSAPIGDYDVEAYLIYGDDTSQRAVVTIHVALDPYGPPD